MIVMPSSFCGSLPHGTGATEYFVYWPVKFIGTLEAFYSKCTGKPAKWGNTGGVASGSIDELPVIFCTLALAVGLFRSIIVFFFVETDTAIYSVIPLWGFGMTMLCIYWPFARVSVQEFMVRMCARMKVSSVPPIEGCSHARRCLSAFTWQHYPYSSLHTRCLGLWFFGVGLMGSTLLLQLRDEGKFGTPP